MTSLSINQLYPNPSKNISFTIYYKEGCPHSMNAVNTIKRLVNENGIPWKFNAYKINTSNQNHINRFYEINKQFGNGQDTHSYPLIFCYGKYVGGNSDLMRILAKKNQ